MSIQQCYENFLSNSLHLDDYKIFCSLVNFGFIVRECLPASNLKNEIIEYKPINKKLVAYNHESDSIIRKGEHGNLTKKQIFERLNDFIPSIKLQDIRSKVVLEKNTLLSNSNKYKPKFDVYLPNKNFKKSQPGKPVYRVSTKFKHTEEGLYVPRLIDFLECNDQSATTKNLFGFANESEPIYYSFNCNFSLPHV